MAEKKWQHLIISPSYTPPVLDGLLDEEGDPMLGRTRGQTYCCNELFPQSTMNLSLSWFYEIPNKNPFVGEHVHDVDEWILFLPGYQGEGDSIDSVWGEAEFCIEGESYLIRDNTCIYCPAGVKHGPITYHRIDRPHCFMSVFLSGRYDREEAGRVLEMVNGQYQWRQKD